MLAWFFSARAARLAHLVAFLGSRRMLDFRDSFPRFLTSLRVLILKELFQSRERLCCARADLAEFSCRCWGQVGYLVPARTEVSHRMFDAFFYGVLKRNSFDLRFGK